MYFGFVVDVGFGVVVGCFFVVNFGELVFGVVGGFVGVVGGFYLYL